MRGERIGQLRLTRCLLFNGVLIFGTASGLGLLEGCSAVHERAGATSAETAAVMSMSDFYAAYEQAWDQQATERAAAYAALRSMTFAEYSKKIAAPDLGVAMDGVNLMPSKAEMASLQTLFAKLGKSYPTVGAFYDAFGIAPRKQTATEIAAALKAVGAQPTSSALSLVVSGAAPQTVVDQCNTWYQQVGNPDLQQAMVQTSINDVRGGGRDNPTLRLYQRAQSQLSTKAWIAFDNFMSNLFYDGQSGKNLKCGTLSNAPWTPQGGDGSSDDGSSNTATSIATD